VRVIPPRAFDPAIPEMMDVATASCGELAGDLDNLRILNRWFGSYRLIRFFLSRWLLPGRSYRLVDLATGSGDIPREIVLWCRARAIGVTIDAVDFSDATLGIARASSAGFPEIRYHRDDIRTFAPGETWDLSLCSLALHHFAEDDATRILERMRLLSSGRALASDLRRCRAGILGIDLLTATLMREPMTRHDARLSIRRAFSEAEFADLARRAGWVDFRQRRFASFRQAIWIG